MPTIVVQVKLVNGQSFKVPVPNNVTFAFLGEKICNLALQTENGVQPPSQTSLTGRACVLLFSGKVCPPDATVHSILGSASRNDYLVAIFKKGTMQAQNSESAVSSCSPKTKDQPTHAATITTRGLDDTPAQESDQKSSLGKRISNELAPGHNRNVAQKTADQHLKAKNQSENASKEFDKVSDSGVGSVAKFKESQKTKKGKLKEELALRHLPEEFENAVSLFASLNATTGVLMKAKQPSTLLNIYRTLSGFSANSSSSMAAFKSLNGPDDLLLWIQKMCSIVYPSTQTGKSENIERKQVEWIGRLCKQLGFEDEFIGEDGLGIQLARVAVPSRDLCERHCRAVLSKTIVSADIAQTVKEDSDEEARTKSARQEFRDDSGIVWEADDQTGMFQSVWRDVTACPSSSMILWLPFIPQKTSKIKSRQTRRGHVSGRGVGASKTMAAHMSLQDAVQNCIDDDLILEWSYMDGQLSSPPTGRSLVSQVAKRVESMRMRLLLQTAVLLQQSTVKVFQDKQLLEIMQYGWTASDLIHCGVSNAKINPCPLTEVLAGGKSLSSSISSGATVVSGNHAAEFSNCDLCQKEIAKAVHVCDNTEVNASELLQHLTEGIAYRGQIVDMRSFPGNVVQSMPVLHADLPAILRDLLLKQGITSLYSHQVDAWKAHSSQKNMVVTTPTASGKSLCYMMPILEEIVSGHGTCLYLAPTKALAHDQLKHMRKMVPDSVDSNAIVETFDGDTSSTRRANILQNARIILTNPDTLHATLLPKHSKAESFFRRLKFIVIDEAHYYTGLFGSHCGLVFRRLGRMVLSYQSSLRWLAASATLNDAAEHMASLTGQPATNWIAVTKDGSPRGPKTYALWNPPERLVFNHQHLSAKEHAIDELPDRQRCSSIVETASIVAECVRHGISAVCFAKSRKLVELVTSYCKRMVALGGQPDAVNRVQPYRSGYSPEERRQLERKISDGSITVLVATSALELGVDIGSLDVTIHLGFQGTMSSLRQQAGRAGRREKQSLCIIVAFNGPLDQYFVQHPERLFNSSIEKTPIDIGNPILLQWHLQCMAAELPLSGDTEISSKSMMQLAKDCTDIVHIDAQDWQSQQEPSNEASKRLILLQNAAMSGECFRTVGQRGVIIAGKLLLEGRLGFREGVGICWRDLDGHGWPHGWMSLRVIDSDVFTIVQKNTNKVLETVERRRAFWALYDGAVYMHLGQEYIIERVCLKSQVAFAVASRVPYFTSVRDSRDLYTRSSLTVGQPNIDTSCGPSYQCPSVGLSQHSHDKEQTANSAAQISQTVEWLHSANHRSHGIHYGGLRVRMRYLGYRKISKRTGKLLDSVDLDLPDYEFDTVATWIPLERNILVKLQRNSVDAVAAMHAANHALMMVVPSFIPCSIFDLDTECVSPLESEISVFRVLLFDKCPGGTGICKQIASLMPSVICRALERVEGCSCMMQDGCPSCVQTSNCAEYNGVLDKAGAIGILRALAKAFPSKD